MRLFAGMAVAFYVALPTSTAAALPVPDDELSCIIDVVRKSPGYKQTIKYFFEKIPPLSSEGSPGIKYIKYQYLYKGKIARAYISVSPAVGRTYTLSVRDLERSMDLTPWSPENPLRGLQNALWQNCAADYRGVQPLGVP